MLEAALRWLADHTPGSAEPLRPMDATPIGCGQSTTTTHRSDLVGWAGYGYESAPSHWYWGVKLLLLTDHRRTCDSLRDGPAPDCEVDSGVLKPDSGSVNHVTRWSD